MNSSNQSHSVADHEDVKSIIDPEKKREKQQEVEDDVSNKGYQCGYYGGVLPCRQILNASVCSDQVLMMIPFL